MPAAVLGDRACGKTTFLALLYAAQIRYTNTPANKDTFRFYAEPGALSFMGDVYNQLKGGSWPQATMKGQKTKVSFTFGFKKMGADLIPKGIQKKDWLNPFMTLNFSVYDVAGEDVNDLIATPDGVLSDSIPDEVRDLLESRIVVVLVDASRASAKPRSKTYMDMLEYDRKTATLISLIAKYNSSRYKDEPAKRKIYPVFVFTKYDSMDKTVLANLSGSVEGYPSLAEPKKRHEFAEKFMRSFYEQTLALIKGGKLVGVNFDEAIYFFSELSTEFDDKGMGVPKLVEMDSGAGHEVEFSYSEYEGFIEHFKKIAKSMPDSVKEEQEIK